METKNREAGDFLRTLMKMSSGAPSPAIFRFWSAIYVIASAMGKRCWTETENGLVYPNLMTILVGPPATGKGPAIDMAELLLQLIDFSSDRAKEQQGIRLGPIDTTAPGIFDELLDPRSLKSFTYNGERVYFRSLTIVAEELITFMHNCDLRMMGSLIRLLNCQDLSQRLRKQGELVVVENPILSLLGGTQPETLHEIFPKAAWGMGLSARTIFIYSDEATPVAVFDLEKLEDQSKVVSYKEKLKLHPFYNIIHHDLEQIAHLKGKFRYTKEAAHKINTWWLGGEANKTKPKHPRLVHYSGKRVLHFLRLAMVFSASRSNDMIITLEDVNNATATLLEAEIYMPRIFERMSSGESHADQMDDILHDIKISYQRKALPLPFHEVQRIVSRRIPIAYVKSVMEALIDQQQIAEVKLDRRWPGAGGRRGFVPNLGEKTA